MQVVDQLVYFMLGRGLDDAVDSILSSTTDSTRQAALWAYCIGMGLTAADGLQRRWRPRRRNVTVRD